MKTGESGCDTSHYQFSATNGGALDQANGYSFSREATSLDGTVRFAAGSYAYFFSAEVRSCPACSPAIHKDRCCRTVPVHHARILRRVLVQDLRVHHGSAEECVMSAARYASRRGCCRMKTSLLLHFRWLAHVYRTTRRSVAALCSTCGASALIEYEYEKILDRASRRAEAASHLSSYETDRELAIRNLRL